MEENKFTGHDSLELIAQMIQQSKKNMKMATWLSCFPWLSTCFSAGPIILFGLLFGS